MRSSEEITLEETAHELTEKDWEAIAVSPYIREKLGLNLDQLLDRAIGVWMNFETSDKAGKVFVLYGVDPQVPQTVLIQRGERIECIDLSE